MIERLKEIKMISVVVPALNSWENVEAAVQLAQRDGNVREVLVLDDGSIEQMSELEDSPLVKLIPTTLPGKGASMEDGLRAAFHEIVLFLDGCLEGLSPDLVRRMTEPIMEHWAAFAKPTCPGPAGPSAAITSQLALRNFFPELDSYCQPFPGIIAARRDLLESFTFETDHGVQIGLLIDAAMSGEVLAEVDIGLAASDPEPVELLGDMASQVLRTVIQRAARYGRFSCRPIEEPRRIHQQITAELAIACSRPQRTMGLALLAMDGVLLQESFIPELVRRTDRLERRLQTQSPAKTADAEGTQAMAAAFAQIPKAVFEDVAHQIPLTEGARETVLGLRQAGYRVGVISDAFPGRGRCSATPRGSGLRDWAPAALPPRDCNRRCHPVARHDPSRARPTNGRPEYKGEKPCTRIIFNTGVNKDCLAPLALGIPRSHASMERGTPGVARRMKHANVTCQRPSAEHGPLAKENPKCPKASRGVPRFVHCFAGSLNS